MNPEDLRRKYKSFGVANYHRRMKAKAVEYKGGKCQQCGYSKCLAALVFHHKNQDEKDFGISSRVLKWEKIKEEIEKCDLLCSNCHHEEHDKLHTIKYNQTMELIRGIIPEQVKIRRVTIPCAGCGKKIRRPEGQTTGYCDTKCSHLKQERAVWPNKETLEKLVWQKPMVRIAFELKVSDVAVKKRCRKYGITTPSLGYWSDKGS